MIITENVEKLILITEKRRSETVRFLIGIVAFLSLWVFVYAVWLSLGCPVPPIFLTNLLLLLSGVLLFFIPIPKSKGLSVKNLGKNLAEGIFLAFVCLAVMAGLKAVVMTVSPNMLRDRPFFDFSVLTAWDAFYAVSVVWQEFIARCVLYEGLSRVTGKKRLLPLAISSLFFGAVHVHLGLVYMSGAVLLLSFFGLIYIKQRSIWGVCVPHYILGLALIVLF